MEGPLDNLCSFCNKPNSNNACSKCKKMLYCSKECQINHWKKNHKIICKYLAEANLLMKRYYSEDSAYFMQALLYTMNRNINYRFINTKTGKEMTESDYKLPFTKYRMEKCKNGKSYIHHLVLVVINPVYKENEKEDKTAIYLKSDETERSCFIENVKNDLGDNKDIDEHPENIPLVTMRLYKRVVSSISDKNEYYHIISFNCYLFTTEEDRTNYNNSDGNIKVDMGVKDDGKSNSTEEKLKEMKKIVEEKGFTPGSDLSVFTKLEGNINIDMINVAKLSSLEAVFNSPQYINEFI